VFGELGLQFGIAWCGGEVEGDRFALGQEVVGDFVVVVFAAVLNGRDDG
jgi:hypothetical protein